MKVTACLRYEAGSMMGGGELQALDTMGALAELGVETEFYNVLNRQFGDVVHFYGSMPYYHDLGQFLKQSKVPYVVSSIFVSRRSGLRLRVKRTLSKLQGAYPKHIRRLLMGAERIFTLSALEERNLVDVFGSDLPRRIRAPIGIDERFHRPDPTLFRDRFGEGTFILHTGSYSERKGQMALIRAARGMDVRLVFAGRVHERPYYEQCVAASSQGTVFLTDLAKEDPLLPAAYAAAEAFVLPSEAEILSASALEAAVAGCRLVLSDSWGAEEFFGTDAEYVNASSPAAVRAGLQRALARTHMRQAQGDAFFERFQWRKVAKAILAQYEEIV